jgi:endoglycosylceramidase
VIGYDLINEPGGDEPTQLNPLYELAGAAIRAVDPNAILFISPAGVTSGGRATRLVQPTFDNIAFAPHYYDAGVYAAHSWNGYQPDAVFNAMATTASQWGAALFLGEFGTPPDVDRGAEYIDEIHRQLDLHEASGAQWVYTPGWTPERKDGWNDEDFSIVDDHGKLRGNFQPRVGESNCGLTGAEPLLIMVVVTRIRRRRTCR